jgi:hypothetical protein
MAQQRVITKPFAYQRGLDAALNYKDKHEDRKRMFAEASQQGVVVEIGAGAEYDRGFAAGERQDELEWRRAHAF